MADAVPFVDQFAAFEPRLGGVERLHGVRAAALARYRAAGLPTRAVEAWKYTGLEPLAALGLVPAVSGAAFVARVPEAAIAAVDGYRVVVVNGRLDPTLCRLADLPQGVAVASLRALMVHDPAAAERVLTDGAEGLPLVALNTAFAADGLVLTVARGVALDRPLHLISIGGGVDGAGVAFHPRHRVRLEPDASATLVESHVGTAAYFANSVIDLALGAGARLAHAVLQNQGAEAFHVGMVRLELAARATYEGFALQTGARLARHELRARIAGEGAECRMGGLTLAAGAQHSDNTTFIDHAAPGSRSRQLFKAVLDERGRGVFQGRVLVRPHAQKTDAHQLSRALLLSRKAEMDGKPELEIYADDVRCSHGATIGSLDQEPMFYLMSRGIDPATAYRMLVEAFATEALDEIQSPAVRAAFATHLTGWLAGRRTETEGAA